MGFCWYKETCCREIRGGIGKHPKNIQASKKSALFQTFLLKMKSNIFSKKMFHLRMDSWMFWMILDGGSIDKKKRPS
jgi:hypothetical protein